MEGSHASSPSASFSSREGWPYSHMKYVSLYGNYLDGRQSGAMGIVSDHPLVYDRRFEKHRNSAVEALIKL